MDPYLEQRGLWEQVHTRLIVAIADELTPLVAPRYRVDIEQRTYLGVMAAEQRAGIPDASVMEPGVRRMREAALAYPIEPEIVETPVESPISERYLEIRVPRTEAVVTAIEILSPTNKLDSRGRATYMAKRRKVLASATNLVEIDLLRAGEPMALAVSPRRRDDYRILVSRARERPRAFLYQFGLRDPIPTIPIPLRADDAEPALALNRLLHEIYARARYDMAIDYAGHAEPALSGGDAEWVDELLREKGVRT
jgi:hypothetical protein